MSTSEERGRLGKDVELSHEAQVELVRLLKDRSYSNAAIAHILRISENTVCVLLLEERINWRQNCLTIGPHDGRPEALWNLSLLQTMYMFSPMQLQALVVERIYQDAMQMVEHGDEPRMPKEWAEKVKELATPKVPRVYQQKIGELTNYYRSPEFKRDLDGAIERYQEGKLNLHYEPRHGHDTLNLLCRIVGVSVSTEASR